MRSKGNSPFSLFSFQDIITGVSGIMIFFVLIMLVDLVTRRDDRYNPPIPDEVAGIDFSEWEAEIRKLEAELTELRELTRLKIVGTEEGASPEVAARLQETMTGRERELAAKLSQIDLLKSKILEAEHALAVSEKAVEEKEKARIRLVARLEELKNKKGVTLIPGRGEAKTPVFVVIGRGGYEVIRLVAGNMYRKWYNYGQFENCIAREVRPLDNRHYTIILMVRPSGMSKMDGFFQTVETLGFTCGRDPLEEDLDVDLAKSEEGAL